MSDKTTTLATLKALQDAFLKERDWHQFHNPKRDSMGISIEAAELMELFLFADPKKDGDQIVAEKRERIEEEIADVFMWVLCFANTTGIDLSEAFHKKMAKNAQKYPVEKCKGKSNKYNEL